MARKDSTPLSTTGRKYLEGTARARLQSPGIERYPARKGGPLPAVALAVVIVGVLVGLMLWWMRGAR
jgi:hypothetical protein